MTEYGQLLTAAMRARFRRESGWHRGAAIEEEDNGTETTIFDRMGGISQNL